MVEKKSTRRSQFSHACWFRIGVDFLHNKEAFKYRNEVSRFSLSDGDFEITNFYNVVSWRFRPLFHVGYDYQLTNKSGVNLFCLNVSYLYNRGSISLEQYILITHTNQASKTSYYYRSLPAFSSFYITLSKEFNFRKKYMAKNEIPD